MTMLYSGVVVLKFLHGYSDGMVRYPSLMMMHNLFLFWATRHKSIRCY